MLYKLNSRLVRVAFLGLILVCMGSPLFAAFMDLSSVTCEEPWASFTTESNKPGILFEDGSRGDNMFFLPMTNIGPTNYTVEMGFSMRSLISQDRTSSVGIWIWDGIETFGKDKSLKGHYLVLFDSRGNMDIKHWNGKYYSNTSHKSRFVFNPGKPQRLKVETSKSGLIKAYLNGKILLTHRSRLKIKKASPIGLCAAAGAWMEVTYFYVK